MRLRAHELIKDLLDTHRSMVLLRQGGSREAFVDVVHAALVEAAMIGVKEAIDGIYKVAGLDEKGQPQLERALATALEDPRYSQPKCHSCGGWVKVEEGGICMPCHTEQEQK